MYAHMYVCVCIYVHVSYVCGVCQGGPQEVGENS